MVEGQEVVFDAPGYLIHGARGVFRGPFVPDSPDDTRCVVVSPKFGAVIIDVRHVKQVDEGENAVTGG